jgi:hypothetical protein
LLNSAGCNTLRLGGCGLLLHLQVRHDETVRLTQRLRSRGRSAKHALRASEVGLAHQLNGVDGKLQRLAEVEARRGRHLWSAGSGERAGT